MKYRLLANYKYQNIDPVEIKTEIKNCIWDNGYIRIDIDGTLTIKKGYAWDGPSGPTIDTKNFMKASLVHDALYQLMREGIVNKNYKDYSDRLLQKICIENGMSKFRSWYVYLSLKWFGKPSTIRQKKYYYLYTA